MISTSHAAPGFRQDPPLPNANQLREIIGRLLATVEEENHLLEKRREVSLDPIIHRKSQLLLELMRAQKSCSPQFLKDNLAGEIHKFKLAMTANQKLLAIHLAAARDVSNTILEVLRQNDSDGTYVGSTRSGRGIQ